MAKVTDKIIINGKTVKNRITMAPTVKFIKNENRQIK